MAEFWEKDEKFDWQSDAPAEDYGVQKSVSLKDTKGKPPASWDVTVDGRKIKATFVKDKGEIGSYQFVDDDGQVKKVMRDPKSGSLMLQPLERPSALAADSFLGDAENFAAGAGKAVSDLGTFGKQAGSLIGNTLGLVSGDTVYDVMEEAKAKRATDEELMGTKAGIAGNIAGNVATMVAGGGALRGVAAGAGRVGQGLAETGAAARTGQALQKAATVGERAGKGLMMPTTKGGAAASGAVMGGAQPFISADEIAKNAAIGGAAGAAGQAVGQGLGRLATAVAGKIKSLRLPPAATPAEISAQANTYDAIVRQEAAAAGIDWRKLPEAQRQQFAQVVKDAVAKPESKELEAASRIARAESQGIPITRAQAEKDLPAMIEQNRATPYSERLQTMRSEQRQALDKQIEDIVSGTKAPTGGEVAAVGESQKTGMRAFEGATKKAVKEAYSKAESEAGDLPVSTDTVLKALMENKGVDGVKPALMKLKDLGAIGINKDGEMIAMSIPAKDLYKVRTVASALQKSPTTAHMGKVLKAEVDAAFDESGIGQYAEAAALRRAQSKQFDELAIPAKLVGKKGQEDLIGDDNLLKWVIGRDTKEIQRYKQALVSGNEALLRPIYKADKDARKIGIQSARDMKAGLMRYIQNQAMVKDELTGAQTISPESFVTAYKRLGGGNMKIAEEKARAILGAKMADRLKYLVQTAEDISTPSAAQAKGSARFNEAISRGLVSLIEMVPVAGRVISSKAGDTAAKVSGSVAARPAKISAYQGARAVPALSAPAVSGAEDRKR